MPPAFVEPAAPSRRAGSCLPRYTSRPVPPAMLRSPGRQRFRYELPAHPRHRRIRTVPAGDHHCGWIEILPPLPPARRLTLGHEGGLRGDRRRVHGPRLRAAAGGEAAGVADRGGGCVSGGRRGLGAELGVRGGPRSLHRPSGAGDEPAVSGSLPVRHRSAPLGGPDAGDRLRLGRDGVDPWRRRGRGGGGAAQSAGLAGEPGRAFRMAGREGARADHRLGALPGRHPASRERAGAGGGLGAGARGVPARQRRAVRGVTGARDRARRPLPGGDGRRVRSRRTGCSSPPTAAPRRSGSCAGGSSRSSPSAASPGLSPLPSRRRWAASGSGGCSPRTRWARPCGGPAISAS